MAGLIAQNYGEALFDLAKESDKLDLFKKELTQLDEVFSTNAELRRFLRHPKIEKKEKKEVLVKILNEEDPYIKNFVQLLIDKNRFSHFSDIVKVFVKMYHEMHGIEVAYVQSARALSEEEQKDIREMLEKKTGKTIEMKTKVNEDLIAGLRIKIKDEVLDNSAATRLARMKEKVVNKAL